MRATRTAGILIVALALAAPMMGAGAADGEVIVATDPINDWSNDPDLGVLGGPLGIDVVELAIAPANGAVEFIVRVNQLDVPPPNEVIRYLWQFKVDGTEFWVQAKSSDIANINFPEDPQGALTHLNGAFRLRGTCGLVADTLSNCFHLMWIDGEFDVENNEIRMRIPLDTELAPEFTSGAVISPDIDAMTASVQVVVSNATTSDSVAVFGSYTI